MVHRPAPLTHQAKASTVWPPRSTITPHSFPGTCRPPSAGLCAGHVRRACLIDRLRFMPQRRCNPSDAHSGASPATRYFFLFQLLFFSIRSSTAHEGHHAPRRTLLGMACQTWPRRHCHVSLCRPVSYVWDRHRPPRSRAVACMCSRLSLRAPFAQRLHQLPW